MLWKQQKRFRSNHIAFNLRQLYMFVLLTFLFWKYRATLISLSLFSQQICSDFLWKRCHPCHSLEVCFIFSLIVDFFRIYCLHTALVSIPLKLHQILNADSLRFSTHTLNISSISLGPSVFRGFILHLLPISQLRVTVSSKSPELQADLHPLLWMHSSFFVLLPNSGWTATNPARPE
jgi:hypothetical protein